jgi:hypothetical protein
MIADNHFVSVVSVKTELQLVESPGHSIDID